MGAPAPELEEGQGYWGLGRRADFASTKAQKTHVSSLCVSLQQFGAFMVCPMSILISRKYGRKIAVLYHSTIANKSVTPPSRSGKVRLLGLPLDVNTGPPGE
ncbi:mfs sugar transporter [Neofusicoccum parvum]|nr:mfs sugar transporter [Neofusicoccum parvum]